MRQIAITQGRVQHQWEPIQPEQLRQPSERRIHCPGKKWEGQYTKERVWVHGKSPSPSTVSKCHSTDCGGSSTTGTDERGTLDVFKKAPFVPPSKKWQRKRGKPFDAVDKPSKPRSRPNPSTWQALVAPPFSESRHETGCIPCRVRNSFADALLVRSPRKVAPRRLISTKAIICRVGPTVPMILSMNCSDPDTSSPTPAGNLVVFSAEGVNHEVTPPLGLK